MRMPLGAALGGRGVGTGLVYPTPPRGYEMVTAVPLAVTMSMPLSDPRVS